MGLCSSSETKTTTATQNPVGANTNTANNATTTDNTRSNDPASAPAHIENPEGVTILDHSTAHLENNENDGGALEVYLDDDVPGEGYQKREGQAAVPTKRRPSMIIPLDAAFPPVMNPDEVVCGAKIGSGSFGEVVHAHYHGFHVAVKKCYVPKKRSEFKEVFDDFVREVTLLQSLTHDRILRYVGKVQDKKTRRLWIATEVMAGSVSTLLQMIKNSGGSHMLSWRLILQIMADAAEGMTFLHETDIIHRDLKAENLLLDEDFRCKVIQVFLCVCLLMFGLVFLMFDLGWVVWVDSGLLCWSIRLCCV
jgi:tRNA A-37 threonylcarbamoyl transferase component Bud32